jgi:L-fuconolactonase
MMTTPKIDAHQHLWDLSRRDQEWTKDIPAIHRSFLEEDLTPLLIENGVDATVLVQTINDSVETEEFLALADKSDVIRGVVGWVDLGSNDVSDHIAGLQRLPGGQRLVGVRHLVQDEPDPDWLRRPEIRSGLEQLGTAGLAFDLLVRPPQMDSAIDTVRSVPGVRFVLDHCGKPPIASGDIESWRAQMVELANFDNVAVKLSGLVTEVSRPQWRVDDLRPYADVVLSYFGAARVMFGSDWPVCLIAATYAQVLDVARTLAEGLSKSDIDAVFGGTALVWYELDLT